ncbi:S28 family serine protease [Gaoshiqia sediminis]|uniref:S28 family serine protease n=1 Tax=Gaoshiqia sediminis TaxID=2986998 RepID=A0AA41YCP7_9BACT|nr:S28 family serine protease [Gaoshiqia sediminis]MCW0482667.1 S28 family serine protease [Gaoshiqia sediminis]
MKKIRPILIGFIFILNASWQSEARDLMQFLQSQPDLSDIREMEGNGFFNNLYQLKIRQPLNHNDTTAGFFNQRVFVAERAVDHPVVLITEGYSAEYAAQPNYINELSLLLDANQICVEHRYFGESIPDSIAWQYLTVENAARDHHRITQLFKLYYSGKWLNTGISKGGQTALAHRAIFPDDVSLTVAYVAPLNFGVQDGRHECFLAQVGSETCRKKIMAFQREILKRRQQMVALLKNYSDARNYNYPISMDEVLDFSVLEYSYSFWQWGHAAHEIPDLSANDQTLFKHFVKISPPDYFSQEGSAHYRAFFYQAARELGYYGYDTEPFSDLLSIASANGYLKRFMIPGNQPVPYHPETSLMVHNFLQNHAKNILLIYGEIDPWSASAASVRKRGNNQVIVLPGGCHKARIQDLPVHQKNKLLKSMKKQLH